MSKDIVIECRKTRIELEHEVLLKEMEVALVGEAGYPITVLTLVLNLKLYESSLAMVFVLWILSIGIILFDEYRYKKKEEIKAKHNEIDKLLFGMAA